MYKALFGLVLAVIVLGAALAMWSETLTVNVTVNTGKVDVSISAQCLEAPEAEGKDVASCTVTPSEDGNSVTVTISNAYPGYKVNVYLTVSNDGTIPVKLYRFSISEYDESALSVTPTMPSNTQIDPGETSTYILSIEVLQGAEQSSTYRFTVTLTFAQWNEVTES